MSRLLGDLTPAFEAKACVLIAKIVEAGIAIVIVDTKRSIFEQEANIRKGVSWTLKSKHIEGRAIDLAPYQEYLLHGTDKIHWDPLDPAWLVMGEIGESLGLIWGGRWKKRDMGHFEESDDSSINDSTPS